MGSSPASSRLDGMKIGLGLLAVAIVGGAAFGVTAVLRDGGETAATATRDAVGQIDVARDAEAQVTLSRVAVAASSVLAQSPTGSTDAVTIDALEAVEPAFTYTTNASTGPEVVSVAAEVSSWSAAVASPTRSCLWVRLDPSGTQTFGSGTPCTGEAASAASDPSW